MKQYITRHTIANEIRMHRSLFGGAFVIVEGVSDKRVFDRIVDIERCVFSIAFGYENAIGVIDILNADSFEGAIAIVDADFTNLGIHRPRLDNVVTTDLHDLDCMLINSPAFDHVLAEFADETRIEAFSANHSPLIANFLATIVVPLGCLQFISLRDHLGLDFKDLNYSHFIDAHTLMLGVREMVVEVLNNSQRHELAVDELVDSINTELACNHDCWQVCVGTDIIALLSLALRRVLASHRAIDVSPTALGRCLRLAFELPYISTTQLYSSIGEWQASNPEFAILTAA